MARNRCRRRLKAVLRTEDAAGRVPPGAYLVGVAPEGVDQPFAALRDHLTAALAALADRRAASAALAPRDQP